MAKASTESRGILYVMATPIGNLADLGARAKETLASVDIVAAEDTRRGGKLLAHLGIRRKIVSLHEHNEETRTAGLVAELEAGRKVALISDAGTPLISDPGLRLVGRARAAGIDVVAIPGPSAVTAALSVSALPTDRFVFEGFLPRRKAERRRRLQSLGTENRTLLFFEAVHRVAATLADMVDAFGGARRATIARELTKRHEQVVTDTLANLAAALGETVPLRGEFVIVVAGKESQDRAGDSEARRVYAILAGELAPSRAAALCARITGRSRNEIYALTRG